MLLHDMQRMKADVVMLQETHFRESNLLLLKNRYFPTTYHSQYTEAKSRGVSILFSARVPWKPLDVRTDKEGRFLFLKGMIGDRKVTFANLYTPNTQQDVFLKRRLDNFQRYTGRTYDE